MNQSRDIHTNHLVLIVPNDLKNTVTGSLVEAATASHTVAKKATKAIDLKKAAAQRKVRRVKSRVKAKNHAEVKNHTEAKNHVAANTGHMIRKAIVPNEAVDLNDPITVAEVILAEDAERESIMLEAKEMFIVNGIKGICGSIDASVKSDTHFLKIMFFETLFKREYDKKGFFLFGREIKLRHHYLSKMKIVRGRHEVFYRRDTQQRFYRSRH
ncbi:hypothetical protein [Bacillus sp. Bos-x628]|uniref:hypothetical protein n=1 Tax=Bacillus maqinnsis TaxID=3229854 RepID=UPI00338D54BC